MAETQAGSGLDLHLNISGTRPARELETALREAIASGRLPPGHRLPPTRGLAADLGIARATVSDVYAQLVAEGWLVSRAGSGTWVASTPGLTVPDAPVPPGPAPQGPAPRGPGKPPSARHRELGSLDGGLPDPSLFPRGEWLGAARRALGSATSADLGYGDPAGVTRLRDQLALYLRRTRGVHAGTGQVLVGHGFGSMLSLFCRTLAAGGARTMAVEAFGHPAHRDIIEAAGLETVPLPVDEKGADVGGAPFTGLGAAAVLLTAAHQFPLGVPLAAERRLAVVRWARATGGLVIEDDYDGEFRYDRRLVGALQSIAPDAVAYLGTASKALAPAVGLSWAVVPGRWREPLLRQRAVLDQPRDALNQLTLAEFFAAHAYDRHVRRMRAEYRRRRELLVAGLAARVPDAKVGGLAAGLQATVYLPGGTGADETVAEGLRRGVSFRTLAEYAAGQPGSCPQAVVIGYGAAPAAHAGRHLSAVVSAIAAVAENTSQERPLSERPTLIPPTTVPRPTR